MSKVVVGVGGEKVGDKKGKVRIYADPGKELTALLQKIKGDEKEPLSFKARLELVLRLVDATEEELTKAVSEGAKKDDKFLLTRSLIQELKDAVNKLAKDYSAIEAEAYRKANYGENPWV